ncbi:AbrB/MazE/SpoVT family DNA-binding domain-containing protein [Dactylosporangium sp. NPDC050688]|uniref:AbrB/MazE/SpoVT family DNA-binding domain-containing protein n=1 Tax=Dactylosporangium sp. NPDC050688 TaxID=3157217 RepID=UPI0033C67DA7
MTQIPYCSITTIDDSGRLADRSPVRLMGWKPGHRLDITVHAGVGRVRASNDGRLTVATRGYVRIPAVVRRLLGTAVGDRVLVMLQPEQELLLVYAMATVTSMLMPPEAPDDVARTS